MGEHFEVRFGDYTLRPETGELLRGSERVRLQEKPLRVLLLLVEHAGQLVTRDDLRHRLWPADTFVDFDRNLNTAVKKLRIAIGDSAEQPRYVETVPRRGYRWIAPIHASDDAPAAPPVECAQTEVSSVTMGGRFTGWLAAAPAALAAVLLAMLATSPGDAKAPNLRNHSCPAQVKLAVMPFQHEGRGLQHTLSTELNESVPRSLLYSRTANVSVLSGRSVQGYFCSKKDFRQMGRELGVGYVMEGNVRRTSAGLRVTAQVFETKSGALIVADSLDVPAEEAGLAQGRIADRVAAAVLRCITPAQRASL